MVKILLIINTIIIVNYLELAHNLPYSLLLITEESFASFFDSIPDYSVISTTRKCLLRSYHVWIAGFILATTIGAFLCRRHISDKKKQKTLIRQLRESENKEARMKELLGHGIQKVGELVDISTLYAVKPELVCEKLNQLLKVSSPENNIFGELRQIMDERCNGAITRFEMAHPMLSSDDIYFCCLLCAEFSVIQMCSIYDFRTPNSVYVKKRRLKRKLRLDKSMKLDLFLMNYIENN